MHNMNVAAIESDKHDDDVNIGIIFILAERVLSANRFKALKRHAPCNVSVIGI